MESFSAVIISSLSKVKVTAVVQYVYISGFALNGLLIVASGEFNENQEKMRKAEEAANKLDKSYENTEKSSGRLKETLKNTWVNTSTTPTLMP